VVQTWQNEPQENAARPGGVQSPKGPRGVWGNPRCQRVDEGSAQQNKENEPKLNDSRAGMQTPTRRHPAPRGSWGNQRCQRVDEGALQIWESQNSERCQAIEEAPTLQRWASENSGRSQTVEEAPALQRWASEPKQNDARARRKGAGRGNFVAKRSVLTETVETTEEKFYAKYHTNEALIEALDEGSTALLRGDWLVRWSQGGHLLPRRQDLPETAFWNVEDLEVAKSTIRDVHTSQEINVIAISYCWFSAEHPDPDGVQLQLIASALEAYHQSTRQWTTPNTAVFLDWCSFYQRPRVGDEEAMFKKALQHTNIWYANAKTKVWCLTTVAEGVREYDMRGWPRFEKAVSQLVHDQGDAISIANVSKGQTWVDIERMGKMSQEAPLHPSDFARLLDDKTDDGDHKIFFTNGKSDRPFVVQKYQDTFEEVLGSAETLNFIGMDWGDEHAATLAKALRQCVRLRDLMLGSNHIGDLGAAALAEALPQIPNLRDLELGKNRIGDRGAESLAQAVAKCQKLQFLDLQNNKVMTGRGAKHLSEAWFSSAKPEANLTRKKGLFF